MKNTENKKENKLDLTKKFELDANEMNQIVGGTTFLMDGTFTDDTTVVSSEPDTPGCNLVLACEYGCKSCTSVRIVVNICKTKFKNK